MKFSVRHDGVIVLFLLSVLSSACWPFDSKFVEACEAAIKDRLRSPSEYKRVEIDEYKDLISPEEVIKYKEAQGLTITKTERHAFESGLWEPAKYTAFIKYDAPNAYGTMIRGIMVCEYVSASGALDYVSEHNILIDGQTNSDRMIEILRKQVQK